MSTREAVGTITDIASVGIGAYGTTYGIPPEISIPLTAQLLRAGTDITANYLESRKKNKEKKHKKKKKKEKKAKKSKKQEE